VKLARHWNRLRRETVESPSIKILKIIELKKAQSNLFQLTML